MCMGHGNWMSVSLHAKVGNRIAHLGKEAIAQVFRSSAGPRCLGCRTEVYAKL